MNISRIPKRLLYELVAEGMAWGSTPTAIAQKIGYSRSYIRKIHADLKGTTDGTETAQRLAKIREICGNTRGTVRPQET